MQYWSAWMLSMYCRNTLTMQWYPCTAATRWQCNDVHVQPQHADNAMMSMYCRNTLTMQYQLIQTCAAASIATEQEVLTCCCSLDCNKINVNNSAYWSGARDSNLPTRFLISWRPNSQTRVHQRAEFVGT